MTDTSRVIVWDPNDGSNVDTINMRLRAALSDDGERAVLLLERDERDDLLYEGVKFCIEISPSTARSDEITAEILKVAERCKVPVG